MVANYVLKNRKALKDGNYIRKAPPRNYFVGFEESLVQGYVERFGEQFNLVIVGDAKRGGGFLCVSIRDNSPVVDGRNNYDSGWGDVQVAFMD